MSRRVVLHIDKHVHMNDVMFYVYRTKTANEDITNKLIMTIFEPAAVKTDYVEPAEKLTRDPYTPYAFYTKRHFEDVPFPDIVVGNTNVLARDILLFSDQKMIEIHNGDLGLADGRNVYMTYTYKAIDVKDDYGSQSGVTYYGPPATGLRQPLNVEIKHDLTLKKIVIKFEANLLPVVYFYRIQAMDTDGNKSPFSQTLSVEITPDSTDLFFRIERSSNGDVWEPVSFSNMLEWYDQVRAIEPPENVKNLVITPLSSKQAKIEMDNPWYWWETYARTSHRYRIRAEDMTGEHTDWLYIDPIVLNIKPKELLIRRKVDNGSPSTETDVDAIDVFRLKEKDVDKTSPTLTLIDDQLSDALKYGYTFFYKDELDMKATLIYATSDHTPWANIILFKGTQKSDNILNKNFLTAFELADRIIEIGTTP